MRLKILIRAYNDFDQILPIIDYIINNSHNKVEVFKTSKNIDLCHSHIGYLNNELNIEIQDFYAYHMSKKEIRYLNLYNTMLLYLCFALQFFQITIISCRNHGYIYIYMSFTDAPGS